MIIVVLNQKFESLSNYLSRIESKTPFSYSELVSDFDLQDIVSINLERATQNCIDIAAHVLSEQNFPVPSTMCDTFLILGQHKLISESLAQNLIKSVGLRNMLVHEYSKINWNIIHDVCHNHLDTYKIFAQVISKLY